MEDILELQQKHFSKQDRSQNLIYTLHRRSGDVTVEVGVIDKQDGKFILCVPTQTNCAQACKFCHSIELAGTVAVSNLTAYEMITIVHRSRGDSGFVAAPEVTLLVSFMGLGEPMANVGNLLSAMINLNHWAAATQVSIRFALSTMIPEKYIADFTKFMNSVQAFQLPVKVHFSLHYTIDNQRLDWMPTASGIAIALSLLGEYKRRTTNPAEIHYTLIGGVNDTLGDAGRLGVLLKGLDIPVKFLHYNPVAGDPHLAPGRDWTQLLRMVVESYGVTTEWYDSPGADIAVSCGMFLNASYLPTKKETALRSEEGLPLYQISLSDPVPASVPTQQEEFLERLDSLEDKARKATPGPYTSAGWVESEQGFEVRSSTGERIRVASTLLARDADYIASVTPEVILELIAIARRKGDTC